jgi:hypothetical protein
VIVQARRRATLHSTIASAELVAATALYERFSTHKFVDRIT